MLPNLFASLPFAAALRPTAVVVRALNAVLRQEPWAQQRLMPYVGRRVSLHLGAWELAFSFSHDGFLVLAPTDKTADVQLTIPSANLSRVPEALAQSSPEAVLALVHIQGDAGLASVLAQVASQLRLDPEAELARFTGDLVAVRIVAMCKQLMHAGKQTWHKLEGNTAEFLGEESGILVSTQYQYLWQERMQQLEQRLQALESRTALLTYKG